MPDAIPSATSPVTSVATPPRPQRALPDPTLGTRFPARLLNVMPRDWKIRHLVRRSGREETSFALGPHLRDARRVVLAWPEDPVEIVAGFPAAHALMEVLPQDTDCIHLCEATCAPLVQCLFPGAVLTWNRTALAWHDPAVRTLRRSLQAFKPDLTLAWSQRRLPLVLQAMLRATAAPVRIGWQDATDAPFANLRLRPDPATPLCAGYFQALDLWRHAGYSPRLAWTHLQPDTGRHDAALHEWQVKRAQPATTWLLALDAESTDTLDAERFEDASARLRARGETGITLGALLWNPAQRPVTRLGPWLDAPVFNETDHPAFLTALEGVRGVIGPHGFALHFAALSEAPVIALLDPSEARYDASGLNTRFDVEWI